MFGQLMGGMMGGAGGGGGSNETSSGIDSNASLSNSSGINFGNYYGSNNVASGQANQGGNPWPWLAGAIVIGAFIIWGKK